MQKQDKPHAKIMTQTPGSTSKTCHNPPNGGGAFVKKLMSLPFDFHQIGGGWGRFAFPFIDDVDDGIQPWVFNCCLLTTN